MANVYSLLWLEAPLQSWGHDSKFGRRDSLDFPTRSGVLGLICCARGEGDEQEAWLKQWDGLEMRVNAFSRIDAQGQPLRRAPLLADFQMVGSGYDDKDPWESLLIPKTSDGKKAVGGGTKLTYRYYIQDMAYAVLLQSPEALAKELESSLLNPVWDLYLGRKCCVPTELVFQGQFDTFQSAEDAATRLAENKERKLSFRVLEGEHDGELLTLNDVPIQFGRRKKYRDRRVTVISTYE